MIHLVPVIARVLARAEQVPRFIEILVGAISIKLTTPPAVSHAKAAVYYI
jgi:hypothetical protein